VFSQRYRPLLFGSVLIFLGWILAYAGYHISINAKITADKVIVSLRATDLTTLSADSRAKALHGLTEKLANLPREERRRVWVDREWVRLIDQMTKEERQTFMKSAVPEGFQQKVAALQLLPEAMRQRVIREALRRVRSGSPPTETGTTGQNESSQATNRASLWSLEFQQSLVKGDLSGLFEESSGQTIWELMPLLDEVERLMESGWIFRQGPR
jgi:hypothetical protein